VTVQQFEVTSQEHLELEAAGWERRFEADATRAKELAELYTELGYEVTTRRIAPQEFGADCGGCAIAACQLDVVVYTKRNQED
jgi:hypothetical protein